MDLRCTICNTAYDRGAHVPHFIPCGCDICAACVHKFVMRTSRPPTPNPRPSSNINASASASQQQSSTTTTNTAGAAATSTLVHTAFKCSRGHVSSAAAINACPPAVAHRIAEQVRDQSHTCPLHGRRPLDFWCVPCRRAMCGACAVTHKDESPSCYLPARPIQQCASELLKLSSECRGQIDHALRNVTGAHAVTARMLKAAGAVPAELMRVSLAAVEQFQARLLKSVDAVWREQSAEAARVRTMHSALAGMASTLQQYRDRVVAGERLCGEDAAAAAADAVTVARSHSSASSSRAGAHAHATASAAAADPVPLAAVLAAIEGDHALRLPIRLQSLRGVDRVFLDPNTGTAGAAWDEPFAGKSDISTWVSSAHSGAAAAAALLDRASPLRDRVVTAAASTLAGVSSSPHASAARAALGRAHLQGGTIPQPLGLLSVTDVLNMGGGRRPPHNIADGSSKRGLSTGGNAAAAAAESAAAAGGDASVSASGVTSPADSRRNTPSRRNKNVTPPAEVPAASGASGYMPFVQLHHYGAAR